MNSNNGKTGEASHVGEIGSYDELKGVFVQKFSMLGLALTMGLLVYFLDPGIAPDYVFKIVAVLAALAVLVGAAEFVYHRRRINAE